MAMSSQSQWVHLYRVMVIGTACLIILLSVCALFYGVLWAGLGVNVLQWGSGAALGAILTAGVAMIRIAFPKEPKS